MNIWSHLKRFFAPPSVADPEQVRNARLLNIIVLGLLLAAVVSSAVLVLLNGINTDLGISFLAVIVLVGVKLVLERGEIRVASWLLSLMLWLIITVSNLFFNGIRDTGISAYALVIALAAVLLGESAAILLGILSLLSVSTLYWAESTGRITVELTPPATINDLIILATVIVLVTFVMRHAVRSIASGFAQARQREDELRVQNQKLQTEIEEREKAQAALRETEARFRVLFAHSPDAILLIDPHDTVVDWPIIDCNDVACQMNGYSREELIGQSVDILNAQPAVPGERDAYLEKLRAAGTMATVEAEHRHKEGQRFTIESATSLVMINGREFVLGVDRDITERKQTEAAIQQANEQLQAQKAELEAINQELDQFAYIVSHDLKAPLRGITNLTDWIEEDMGDDLPDDVGEHLVLLRERIERMRRMIDGILRYSRAGRRRSSREMVDVNALLVDVFDLLNPPPGFTITCAPDMPAVWAEKVKLEQVFSNLISNAIKYHDRADGRIGITVTETAAAHQFAVIDDGPGIAPEFHDKIFVMFQSATERRDVDSSGVGLAIVKKIVEEHGGRIGVESAVGKGATFYFTWPKRDAAGGAA